MLNYFTVTNYELLTRVLLIDKRDILAWPIAFYIGSSCLNTSVI